MAIALYFSAPVLAYMILHNAAYKVGGTKRGADDAYEWLADKMYPWRWKKPRVYYIGWTGQKYSRKRVMRMKSVMIYTDGACSGNPGPGGWGAVLIYGTTEKELSGGAAQTTNNRMELTAAIEALSALKEPCIVALHSDSKYVIDALVKGWAKKWQANGWVKPDKKPALNPDLWEKLLALCEFHSVSLFWVKGHASNPYNNRCDALAVAESKKYL